MYLLLTRIGRFFKELSPLVTAAAALALALSSVVLISLGLDDKYGIYFDVLMILPTGLFVLWTIARILARRGHIIKDDIPQVVKYFRTPEQFSQIFDHCVEIAPGSLRLQNQLAENKGYKWPETEADIEKISSINSAAFRGTPWAGSEAEKYARNLAMWRKNPKTFLMIMAQESTGEITKDPIFFSHILPMSDHGYHHYFETAESGDNEFNPNWIADPGAAVKGLLLFTIARDPDREDLKAADADQKLPRYLYAVAYHIQAILENYPDQQYVTLYFQNSEKKFKRLAELAGFKKSRLLTYDEETVYVVSVDNSHFCNQGSGNG